MICSSLFSLKPDSVVDPFLVVLNKLFASSWDWKVLLRPGRIYRDNYEINRKRICNKKAKEKESLKGVACRQKGAE